MSTAINSALEFSHIRAAELSKYEELRVRITLDGNIQESLESTLDAGVHTWREPFSFAANAVSLCEIHVLTKKRKFFCCTGRYKTIRTTRLHCIGELLDTRSSHGVVQLPLYDSTKTDANGAALGSVAFLIVDTSVLNDGLKQLSTRDSVSYKEGSYAPSFWYPRPEAVPEKLSLAESESEVPISPPPRPRAPTPPASPSSASPIHRPLYVPPQPPLPPPNILTPQYLQTTGQLPQCCFAYSPQKSGVDRIPTEMQTYGDAMVHPKYDPGLPFDGTMTAILSLGEEGSASGLAPQSSAEIGNFTPVICEPPEDIDPEGSEAWPSVPPHMTESASLTPLDAFQNGYEHGTIPQISITLAKSSRGNSPLAPSACDSDVTVKRPSVHVDTGSATQTAGVTSALSVYPGCADELSPFSRSSVLASPPPRTSTTITSSPTLSPFSRTSMAESPSTAATTPGISETPKDALASGPGSPAKQRKERPTIDTSCVGPRGQVRKYRNGSVPPVHVPVKLRNASLDLPRSQEREKFEPNPSMYTIAPSISPPHFKKGGDSRCPSSQPPASRQGMVSGTRAPSIRREPLEFDDAQICLDTANLGDQEVATFLKEVDAALSAIVNNGSPAVAADSRAFLAVPSATSRLASRHQSRKSSSQHLRADLSATVRSHEKEGAARFSLVATSHSSPHSDLVSSRAASPLTGHRDAVQRMFLTQVDRPAGSLAGSPSRSAMPPSAFSRSQRVTPQPSPRQELVEWVSPSFVTSLSTRTKERPQLSRPGSYYGDVSGNENTSEVFRLEMPPHAVRGRHA